MKTSYVRPSIRQRLDRIKSPVQREAALSWLARYSNSAEPRVLERLAVDWAYLARRHGNADDKAQLYFSLFSRLARLPMERLPNFETVRYLLRSLRRFPFTKNWECLNRQLAEADSAITPSIWQPIHKQNRKREIERHTAKVTFAEMYEVLEELSSVFASGEQPLPLEQTKANLNSLTAFTDGNKIFLSEAVAISPHKTLNRLAFARLLLHEYLHSQLGHFNFSFRTIEGRNLWQRLMPHRDIFKINRVMWDGMQTLKRLLDAGEYIPEDREPFLPHLQAFLMHFEEHCQSGVHGLLNILLDVMVEKQLAATWPELGEIAQIIQQYESALLPDPRFLSPSKNFQTALFDRAFGRSSPAHIFRPYVVAWKEIAKVLDTYRDGPLGTIYDGVRTTLELIEIMARCLPQELVKNSLEGFQNFASVSVEEVSFRRELSSEKYHPGKPAQKVHYPFSVEQRPSGDGHWYDEFNAWDNATEKDAVFVVEKPWVLFRSPYILSPPWNTRPFMLDRQFETALDEPVLRSEGVNLDLDRFHDFYVEVHSGQAADDRVFIEQIEKPVSCSGWACTFAVDLSVSMEAVRSKHSAVPPIVLALETIESMVTALENSSVPTAVWGVHDLGRRPVTLWQAKTFDQRLDPQAIRSMHAIGVGGARIGAVIRHASHVAANQLRDRKHILVILTDSASHYQTIGLDDYLSEKIVSRTCSKCQVRPNC